MYQPFTYVITHNQSGKRYYGVRYAKGCNPSDLWTTYFTSSKLILSIIDSEGPESFTYQVRRTFINKCDAIDWEYKVLRRLKVLTNENWFNMNIQGKIRKFSEFRTDSEKEVTKNRKQQSFENRTIEQKKIRFEQVSKQFSGIKQTDEHIQKRTAHRKGIKLTDAQKQFLRTPKRDSSKMGKYDRNIFYCESCDKEVKGLNNFNRWHKNCQNNME